MMTRKMKQKESYTPLAPGITLTPGTKVQVQNKRGTVIKCEVQRDQFGSPIPVHTVLLTEIFSHRRGNQTVYRPLKKPRQQTVNYSFITVI